MTSLFSRLWLLSHICFWGWHNNDNDFNQQATHVFELWMIGTKVRNPKSFKIHCQPHRAAVTPDHLHLHCHQPSSSRFFASYFPIPLDVSFRCQSTMIKPSMTWRMPSNLKKWTISKTSTLTSSSYTRCSCLPPSSWHAALSLLLTCSLNHWFQITNIYWRHWVTWNSMKVTMQLTSWHLQWSWRRSFRMELWEAIYTLSCIRQVRVSSNGGC